MHIVKKVKKMGNKVGLIGLAVMGENLALNMESKGYTVSVFNRTGEKTRRFIEGKAKNKNFNATYSHEEFVNSLPTPRTVFLMVKAGEAVDSTIAQLRPLLDRGDIIIDGGNCHFEKTQQREQELAKDGIFFLGVGVSGGEEGALKGPCIMPGGSEEAYREVKQLLNDMAAKTASGVCCTYLGHGGAGHYVKMVHNGIEYGIMQIIAEIYNLLRNILMLPADEVSKIFYAWNERECGSFLVEITADILSQIDERSKKPAVDIISDKAGQKGTGIWTSKSGLDLGVPIPTINAAVSERSLSGVDERAGISSIASRCTVKGEKIEEKYKEEIAEKAYNALLCAKILTYNQGFSLLAASKKAYGFKLPMAEIASIWQGGCIIRSKVLERFRDFFSGSPKKENILLDPNQAGEIGMLSKSLREVIEISNQHRKPTAALSASLNYILSISSPCLPINLIQAQRDYFGAHTYIPIGEEKAVHREWKKL